MQWIPAFSTVTQVWGLQTGLNLPEEDLAAAMQRVLSLTAEQLVFTVVKRVQKW